MYLGKRVLKNVLKYLPILIIFCAQHPEAAFPTGAMGTGAGPLRGTRGVKGIDAGFNMTGPITGINGPL